MNDKEFFRIGRTRISVTDEDKAILTIKDAVHRKQNGYVCISTLSTVQQLCGHLSVLPNRIS